jgi:hypothetical protein
MRTKVAGLCLLLVLVPLSAGAQPKKDKRKAPEFSGTDPKETLRWLVSVGDEFPDADRGSNALAREKQRKEAQEKLDRTIGEGRKITWLMPVALVNRGGVYVQDFNTERVFVAFAPGRGGYSPFTHQGSEEWLLGLRCGDRVEVVAEIKAIKHKGLSGNLHQFTIYLKNAVVKPKD